MRRLTKTATAPLVIGGVAVLALESARRIFRRTHVFLPEREPVISWNPDDYGIPPGCTEELWIETDDGAVLYGWYCRAETPIASTVYCHGNTGNLTNTAFVIPNLLAGGINVLFFDYRGYGRSTGTASFAGVVDDGVAVARVHETIRPKHLPSILYGFSLGGAIAAQVIQRHSFDGLILQSTFTNLPDITRIAFPNVPLHLFSGRVFDTEAVLRKLTIPVLFIHGGADEFCPCSMAHQLHDACCSGHKRLIIIDGGMHKDVWLRDPDALIWQVNRFAADLPVSQHAVHVPPGALDQIVDAALRSVRRFIRRRSAQHPAALVKAS